VHRKTHLHNDLSSQLFAESNSSRHRKDCPSLQDSIAIKQSQSVLGRRYFRTARESARNDVA
jgi:hypothetical protein